MDEIVTLLTEERFRGKMVRHISPTSPLDLPIASAARWSSSSPPNPNPSPSPNPSPNPNPNPNPDQVVIFAGYSGQMSDLLDRVNP